MSTPLTVFPPTPPLPRQYTTTPDNREDDPMAWMAYGLCTQTDPEIFTPEKGASVLDAKRICADCEVRAVCLQWALDHNETRSVWGGLSPKQRAKLRQGTPLHTAVHGTDAMYRKGCHTDQDCPNTYTCAQAHRDYQREWEHRRNTEGRGRYQRKDGAA